MLVPEKIIIGFLPYMGLATILETSIMSMNFRFHVLKSLEERDGLVFRPRSPDPEGRRPQSGPIVLWP